MFTPRRVSVVLVTALGTCVLLAAPASAHTAAWRRTCTTVTVDLTKFAVSTQGRPNQVDVYRNGRRLDHISFTGRTVRRTYAEAPTGDVTYEAVWSRTGADRASRKVTRTLAAPAGCARATKPAGAQPAPSLTARPAASSRQDDRTTTAVIVIGEILVAALGIGAGVRLLLGLRPAARLAGPARHRRDAPGA